MSVQFGDSLLTLQEHRSDQLLATGLYLIACFRENELAPYSWMMMDGSSLVLNGVVYPHYRYFLLHNIRMEDRNKR